MTNHTPAPWHYAQWEDGDNAIVTAEGDGRICEMVTNEPAGVRDANGELIAAAPELHDALRELCTTLTAIDAVMMPTGDEEHNAADAYHDAIRVLSQLERRVGPLNS